MAGFWHLHLSLPAHLSAVSTMPLPCPACPPFPACPSPAHRVPSPCLVPLFQLVPRLESVHWTHGDGPGIAAGSSASTSPPPREVHLLAWPFRDVGTRSPAQERRWGRGLSTRAAGVGRAAGVYTGCSCCRRRSSRQQQKLAPATRSDHRRPHGYTAEMGFRARVWHVALWDGEPRQGRRPQTGPLLQS